MNKKIFSSLLRSFITSNACVKTLAISAGAFSVLTSDAALFGEYTFDSGPGPSVYNGNVDLSAGLSGSGAVTLDYTTSPGALHITGWDSSSYVTFTVTAHAGYQLSSLVLNFMPDSNVELSTLRVEAFSGATSAGFQDNVLHTGSPAYENFTFSPAISSADAVSFRFSSSGLGSSDWLRFNNITVQGDVSAVPEPVNIALVAFGLVSVCTCVGRRVYARARG